jgi:hypothetical protein
VTAASDIDATATVNGVAVGAVSIAALIPTAWAIGVTRAFAGDGTNVRASSLNLLADSDVKALATTKAIAVGLAAGNGGSAEAIVASDTEAYLGERFDTVRVTQADVQIRTVAGAPGPVNVDAVSVSVAEAINEGSPRSRCRQHPPADRQAVAHAGIHRTAHNADREHGRRVRPRRRVEGHGEGPDHDGCGAQRLDRRFRCHRQPHHRGLRRSPRHAAARRELADAEGVVTAGPSERDDAGLHRRGARRRGRVLDARRHRRRRRVPATDGFTPGVRRGQVEPPAPAVRPACACHPRLHRCDASVTAGTTHLDADSDAESTATIKHAASPFVSVSSADVLAVTKHDTEAWIGDRATLTLTGR